MSENYEIMKVLTTLAYKEETTEEEIEALNKAMGILESQDAQKHNNYTNYPTWLLASAIDNNEKLYNFFRNLASNAELTTVYRTLEELIQTDTKFMKEVNECLLNYVHENINIAEIARMMKEEYND